MIKKASIRRIFVATIALLFVGISLYIFPENEIKIPSKTIYKKAETSAIYLIDKNNYVARTTINIDKKNKEELAKELINALINGSEKNKYLPNGFKSVVPKGTKLLNIIIDNDLIKVYFNDNFLNINYGDEEKVIETIVYTLTEIKNINKVQIYINNELLTRLPNTDKILPEILTRKIGINKKSTFNSFKNTQEVTTYFINKINNETYYIPITFITNNENEKIEVIIKELESKDNIDDNLLTYIQAGIELKNYEILENELNLEFNNLIFNDFNKIDEEVMYGIALSVKDSYDIKITSFTVDNKKIDSLDLN